MCKFRFADEPHSVARFNACQSQCRIARFLSGEDIDDGNCICEAPRECYFNLGNLFVNVTRDEDDEEFDAIEAQTALFPDVKSYIQQVWSE